MRSTGISTVAFEDCDLRGADLTGAHFETVELRGCELDGLRGANSLRGIRMPWSDIVENAGLFAGACGVDVLDD
ncbi:MAG TPA: pentapeptide repeat-containing protein [Thermoleophilaceae bacterium]